MNSYTDPHLRRRSVLVAVLNNRADLRRAASEGWYRIPQRRAPRRIGADFLAFYQTGAFRGEPEAQTVSFLAPIRRYRLHTRAELLPEQADHPRAEEYYFRIEIGPLTRLDRPIPAARMRRITFIHTTLERLATAQDVSDLFRQSSGFDTLWQALQANRLRPLPNRLAGEWPVDIALRVRSGYLGIRCRPEEDQQREVGLSHSRWTILAIDENQIERDLPTCLQRIASTLVSLGGSLDSRPGPEISLT